MAYTLGDAARATGKSKPTIAKAIKRGLISAVKAEDGSYQIGPAELHRVYPMASKTTGNGLQQDTPVDTPAALELLRSQAAEYRETIRDLRSRLYRETEERRQLIALLTGPNRRPWWRRWFR